MKSFTRRHFLKTSAVVSAAPILAVNQNAASVQAQDASASAPKKEKRWFKGQLHTHSQWSDGQPMPESMCAMYKEGGYDYFCLSDHNGFQSEDLKFNGFGFSAAPSDLSAFEGENSTWKWINAKGGWAQLTMASIDYAKKKFGEDSVKMKVVGDKTFVRLKTYKELQAQFEEPGKFLMIPGFEQTGGSKDGLQVHMNFVNVNSVFPYISSATAADTVHDNFTEGAKIYEKNEEPYIFTLNHPQWPYYDVSPEVLKRIEKVRFYELTNNTLSGGPVFDQGWKPERFWDAVNAFRAANGKQLLFGTGSDDAHSLDRWKQGHPFFGWDMVRAEELSASAILEAMNRGDFYVSTGITLKDVQACPETKTLSVTLPEGVSAKIEFIGTKKFFDRKVAQVQSPKPSRKVDVYDAQIGIVLKTVEGNSGSYTLQNDDLYVRARITFPESAEPTEKCQVLRPCAWTQPFAG